MTGYSRRERGRVEWFNADEGYGSIISDDLNDSLFVHFSSIVQDGGFRALSDGQLVEYTRIVQPGPEGIRAVATDVVVAQK